MTCHITTIGWTKCYQDCKLVRLHAKQGGAQNYISYLLTKCSDLQQESHVSAYLLFLYIYYLHLSDVLIRQAQLVLPSLFQGMLHIRLPGVCDFTKRTVIFSLIKANITPVTVFFPFV